MAGGTTGDRPAAAAFEHLKEEDCEKGKGKSPGRVGDPDRAPAQPDPFQEDSRRTMRGHRLPGLLRMLFKFAVAMLWYCLPAGAFPLGAAQGLCAHAAL